MFNLKRFPDQFLNWRTMELKRRFVSTELPTMEKIFFWLPLFCRRYRLCIGSCNQAFTVLANSCYLCLKSLALVFAIFDDIRVDFRNCLLCFPHLFDCMTTFQPLHKHRINSIIFHNTLLRSSENKTGHQSRHVSPYLVSLLAFSEKCQQTTQLIYVSYER